MKKGSLRYVSNGRKFRSSDFPGFLKCVFLMFLIALFASCTEQKSKYRIGVSQCSSDIWREKLNTELLMGTYFHEDVELLFASADDSDERQISQIGRAHV